ncbi:TniQ protein [Pseudomonas sp. SJZ080]|uniref:TniQ family protein n=1 Tax=Pseudomonas sp. SJZ080 TaxID=2572888 RepID=UPI00119BDBA4|nr:TniQ family protein [Pseudomonas sp. SJZ080]TWC45404.1 TniQ protein [Pseudomonas sp. SJZ080]
MHYIPRVFPDELYISIFNRLRHLFGDMSTPKGRSKPKHRVDNSRTLKQLHAELKLDSEVLIEDFNWGHTFDPLLHYPHSNSVSRSSGFTKYSSVMCPDCIRDDIKLHGVAYVHRSHNFPKINFCHIHSTQLQHSCSSCSRSHLLHTTSEYYECSNSPLHELSIKPTAPPIELEHAKFIHDLLNSKKTSIKAGSITQAILNRAIELGLNQGIALDINAVAVHAEAVLSGTSLTLVVPSRRILSNGVTLEYYFLIIFVLFKDASRFLEYVNTCQSKGFTSQAYSELKEKRTRLNNILMHCTYNDIQELFSDHFELIKWLKKNDPCQTSRKLKKYNLTSKPRTSDENVAGEILKLAKEIYSCEGMPIRVTAKRITEGLKSRKSLPTKKLQGRPKLAQALKNTVESTHHYYIRLILWAASNLGIHERKINQLKALTGIPTARLQPVVEYFGWLIGGCLVTSLPRNISELSVPVTWSLPNTSSSPPPGDLILGITK